MRFALLVLLAVGCEAPYEVRLVESIPGTPIDGGVVYSTATAVTRPMKSMECEERGYSWRVGKCWNR